MMKKLLLILLVIVAIILYGSVYILDQREQALILQFGEPVDVVNEISKNESRYPTQKYI